MSGYKTLAFGAGLAVLGFLQTFDWATIVPASWTGPVLAIVGGVIVVLRAFTSTPIGVAK